MKQFHKEPVDDKV